MRLFATAAAILALTSFGLISGARAESYRLTNEQLDLVTAAGGQIASIGPVKTKAAKSRLPKRGVKRWGGQIASI